MKIEIEHEEYLQRLQSEYRRGFHDGVTAWKTQEGCPLDPDAPRATLRTTTGGAEAPAQFLYDPPPYSQTTYPGGDMPGYTKCEINQQGANHV